MLRFWTLTVATALVAATAIGAEAPSLESRRKALNDLLAEQWEYTLSTNPEFASILGDKRWNDKASDTAGFPEQEQLNKTLMVRQLKEGLEGAKFKSWEMPVAQNYGIQIQAPQLV